MKQDKKPKKKKKKSKKTKKGNDGNVEENDPNNPYSALDVDVATSQGAIILVSDSDSDNEEAPPRCCGCRKKKPKDVKLNKTDKKFSES